MNRFLLSLLSVAAFAVATPLHAAQPLKIGYSDWPGWVAWEVAIQKGWFKEAGVDVEFVWFEYVASMDAYAGGNLDAVGMTNGDALVTGATGRKATTILINDYSNGNDMIIAKPGITSIKDLKGKKVGLELNFVSHLMLLKALEAEGMTESDVELVNIVTSDTPQALASGAVDAIGCWQPASSQALTMVPGSTAIFTSKNVPGLIYDALYVSPESLASRRDDWAKVVALWPRVVAFVKDPATQPEALKYMSARVGLTPEAYAPFLDGTYLLDAAEMKQRFTPGDGLSSVTGSTAIVDAFNVKYGVYEAGAAGELSSYFDSSLIMSVK